MPLLRAPENRRTGIEINPNVRYPDQTEAAIGFTSSRDEDCLASDRLTLAPSAAKSVFIQGAYGTTEVVPFPKLARTVVLRQGRTGQAPSLHDYFRRLRRGKPRLYKISVPPRIQSVA